MEDSEEETNLTLSGLIVKNRQLEQKIVQLESKLELMMELFDKYAR